MKKQLLTGALILISFLTTNAQQISQNTDKVTVEAGGSVGCPTAGAVNTFSRSFKLTDFDITETWYVSQVEFGIQSYFAGNNVTIKLSTTSQGYPGGYPGSLTQLSTQTVTFTEEGDQLFILKQVPITATVPAGSELVVEISGADFFIGGNKAGSEAPSFLMAPDCGATVPADVKGLGEPGDFDDVNFVINVTGSTTASVNEVLSSKISVFPNPTNNIVNISNTENILIKDITIADLNGRTVKTINQANGATEAQINVSDLANGMYMMTIFSDKGTMVKKIFKN